ncbi:MAG: hypothetical protein HYS23_00500 [Geobacter sp.]|nr:hypothetical protein [Geobacter sp.]
MRHIYSISMCIVLSMVFLVAELTSHVPSAFATDWRRPGSQREAVEGTPSGGGGYNGPSQSDIRESEERAERNARYDAILKQVSDAWERGDYREELRLLREQQALRDGPNVRADIAKLEQYLAEQANIELGDKYNQQADSAKANGDFNLALKLYKQALATYPNPTSEYRQFIADYEKYVEQKAKDLDERLKREAKAAELERRHRPEVERLRAEAKVIIDMNPADALAKLDAALKLLPDDSKTTGDWWLAQASLALHEARYDAAFEALQKTEGYGLDAAEVARWNSRVKDERERQGANVQNAFGDVRRRLAASSGVIEPGAQLKSIKHSSEEALSSSVAEKSFLTAGSADRKMAGEVFDTPGEYRGDLVYPDKNGQKPELTSSLEAHVPKEAKSNKQIQKSFAWYRHLDSQKAETTQKIAAVKEQLKNGTGDAAVLTAHLGTLNNRMKQIGINQIKATEAVKKQLKNLGLAWTESATPETPKTPAGKGANSPPAEAQAQPTLDFIK